MNELTYRALVWLTYRLAATFAVGVPLVLLMGSAWRREPMVLRLLGVYWKVASLMAISLLLLMDQRPLGYATAAVAHDPLAEHRVPVLQQRALSRRLRPGTPLEAQGPREDDNQHEEAEDLRSLLFTARGFLALPLRTCRKHHCHYRKHHCQRKQVP